MLSYTGRGLTGGGGGGVPPFFLPGLPLQIFNAVHFLNEFPSFYKILTLDPPSKNFLDLPLQARLHELRAVC